MEEIKITLERHEQHIKSLQHQVDELKAVQHEIRSMNETLVTLTSELKHTNEHLARHERQIAEMENQPKVRWNQLVAAIIAALAGGVAAAALTGSFARI